MPACQSAIMFNIKTKSTDDSTPINNVNMPNTTDELNQLKIVRTVLNPRTYIIRTSHQKRLSAAPQPPIFTLANFKIYIPVVINKAATGSQRIFRPYFETGLRINVIEHEQILKTDNNIAVNLCNSRNLSVSSFIRQPNEPKTRIIDDLVSVGRTKESDDSISVIHALL